MKQKKSNKPYKPVKESTSVPKDLSYLLNDYASKEEKELFLAGLSSHPVSGLLRNQDFLKEETLLSQFPDLCKDKKDPLLFRFDKEEDRMGKTLLHFAGGFYILDPSSALISYYLAPLLKKNPLVLDFCAAPGGKSIALSLRRKDALILSNDISYKRALEITKNVDRLGLTNILSLSIDPMKFRMEDYFDCIILDAPCSGSGMIRKEPKMLSDYSEDKVDRLLPIQADLLDKAYQLVNKDGIIAYSTCSLSIKEDEEQVRCFLKKHPDVEVINIKVEKDVVKGQDNLGYHLIPGIYLGEGIYFILLRKTSGENYVHNEIRYLAEKDKKEEDLHYIPYRKNLYLADRLYEGLLDLPFIAPGLKIKDDSEHPKCEYDHAYSKGAKQIPLYPLTKEEAISYASGNEITIHSDNEDGIYILTYEGMRLGFGKKVQNRIKNHLPKGLRMNLIG